LHLNLPRRTGRVTLTTALLVLLLTAGCSNGAVEEQTNPTSLQELPMVALNVPGVTVSEVVAAPDAPLADNDLVIGLSVGTIPRAYALRAFRPPGTFSLEDVHRPEIASQLGVHVVNDILGATPVTVTYCNRTHCTRVLTDPQRHDRLDVGLGGWRNGHMQLLINGEQVSQWSPELPLADLDHAVFTWKEWRDLHPDTDVYVGNLTLEGKTSP
jgi:hypothetical protein